MASFFISKGKLATSSQDNKHLSRQNYPIFATLTELKTGMKQSTLCSRCSTAAQWICS